MKRLIIVSLLFLCYSEFYSQITIETNLPRVLPVNSELDFDVKINKGNLTNFSKYQFLVPRDMILKQIDNKGGSFSYEDDLAKIIWVMTPSEPQIHLKFRLVTGSVNSNRVLVQKYFYIENDNKRDVEIESIHVAVKDSTIPLVTVPFYTLVPKMPASLITTTINVDEISTKRPEVLIQQVIQLRKDSKDAFEVGQREKKEAEQKIKEANVAITTASEMSSDTERQAALESANADKQKAEKDLEVAERVLVLAKSLEDNANEIEKINKAVNPGSYKNQQQVTIASANTKPTNSGTTATVNIDRLEEVLGPPASKKKDKNSQSDEISKVDEIGLVYKIQLGAFSKKPSKSDFKAVGKVKITEENGMYKVLYGTFTTKEAAIQERLNVLSKGFDGFVVTYQNGSRIN